MRAYFAVITDSFRAALASRILWILLILITGFLLAHAPIGVIETKKTDIRHEDLRDPARFVKRLNEQRISEQSSPGKHIASLLDNGTTQLLKELEDDETSGYEYIYKLGQIVEQLDVVLDRRDFFDEEAWTDVELPAEAKSLLARGVAKLTDKQLRRFNHLVLFSAYDGEFRSVPATSLQCSYAIWDVLPPLPLTETDGKTQVSSYIANYIDIFIDFLVGVFGVFVALLVTAQIIPETYEKGSIELLLSKPVSRILLFLAKFLGACSFVLLNVGYLLIGLWLIAGLRLGVWETKFLICIPMFLFYFMIFYVVSALAGLIWRNAIVSVVLTILFAGMCLGVGFAVSLLEELAIRPSTIIQILPTKDMTVSVTERNKVKQWNANDAVWNEIFVDAAMANVNMPIEVPSQPMHGPVHRRQGDQWLAIPHWGVGHFANISGGESTLMAADRDELHTRMPVATAPAGAISLFVDSSGNAVTVAADGIYRLPGESIKPVDRDPDDDLFEELPKFDRVSAADLPDWWAPTEAALDPDTDRLAVWNSDHLAVYELDETKQYQLKKDVALKANERQAAVMAVAGSNVLVAGADGSVWILDSTTLERLEQHQPEGRNPPRFVHASPDGKWFAIVFHNRKLWLYDTAAKKLSQPWIARQGDISAAAFAGTGELLVADRTTRISQYELNDLTLQRRLAPKMGVWEKIYRYAASPLYAVFPRPTELDNTVQYLLTGKETESEAFASTNLKNPQQHYDPWTPVISSFVFLVAMLFVCSLYCYRCEF